jgi:hypothetical protein
VAFSPDGDLLAPADGNSGVQLWNPPPARPLTVHSPQIASTS